jgi:hypothetical protein
MSELRRIPVDATAPQPWRNGGGVTRELLAWPAADDWRVRVSVADIESDGRFSSFPGVQRWFAVLQGAGVDLAVDGATHRCLRTDAPFRFDGGSVTTCRLVDGPTRDLNLMLRRAQGSLQAAASGAAWRPEAEHAGFFAALAGRCRFDGESVALPAQTLLWLDAAPAAMSFVADDASATAVGWWIAASTPEEGA